MVMIVAEVKSVSGNPLFEVQHVNGYLNSKTGEVSNQTLSDPFTSKADADEHMVFLQAMRDIQQQGRALREPPVGDVLIIDHAGKWGLPPKPVDPKPAPDNVGKWGKAVVPTKDKWGRPS